MERPEDTAFRFLSDYHNGDEELIRGWRSEADRRYALTLQLCHSYTEEIERLRTALKEVRQAIDEYGLDDFENTTNEALAKIDNALAGERT